MNFEIHSEILETPSLEMKFNLVPWDTNIFGRTVAEITHFRLIDEIRAVQDFTYFEEWCCSNDVALCSCRINHAELKESIFLENMNFRFIELNYRPYLYNLQNVNIEEYNVHVEEAETGDKEMLADMAYRVYKHGRFQKDPRLMRELGDIRYRQWMLNSFDNPWQRTIKAKLDDEVVAFFVIENPKPGHCFWSLVGMAPGFEGQGLGKKISKSMLRQHQRDGIDNITTSISSQNLAALNLYVCLGFRFPVPQMIFHRTSSLP